jgi:hypothetical protein
LVTLGWVVLGGVGSFLLLRSSIFAAAPDSVTGQVSEGEDAAMIIFAVIASAFVVWVGLTMLGHLVRLGEVGQGLLYRERPGVAEGHALRPRGGQALADRGRGAHRGVHPLGRFGLPSLGARRCACAPRVGRFGDGRFVAEGFGVLFAGGFRLIVGSWFSGTRKLREASDGHLGDPLLAHFGTRWGHAPIRTK